MTKWEYKVIKSRHAIEDTAVNMPLKLLGYNEWELASVIFVASRSSILSEGYWLYYFKRPVAEQ